MSALPQMRLANKPTIPSSPRQNAGHHPGNAHSTPPNADPKNFPPHSAGSVPRLSDDFYISQDRVFGNPLKQRGFDQEFAGAIPAESRARSIGSHQRASRSPNNERRQDVIPHYRMIGVNGVAGSSVVLVVSLVFASV